MPFNFEDLKDSGALEDLKSIRRGIEKESLRIDHQFRGSYYDLKTLYRATLTTPAFWETKSRGTIVKSPVDMVVGTVRSTGFLPAYWTSFPS